MKLFNEEKLPEFIESAQTRCVNFLSSYLEQTGLNGFVVGISGGIDSAVVSTLCAMTGKKVMCIEMPIHQNKEHVSRAKNHIQDLKSRFSNVDSIEVDLTETFDLTEKTLNSTFFSSELSDYDRNLSLANTRARLRMSTLYAYSNAYGYLVAGTGNRVEDFGVGFYTKGGDGTVDISVIGDLMKSEVRLLAKKIGVGDEIIQAAPSDGLWGDSRSDEDQLGATYEELEWAMLYCEAESYMEYISKDITVLKVSDSCFEGDSLSERQKEVLAIFLKRHNANRHKMTSIPICEQDRDMLNLVKTFES